MLHGLLFGVHVFYTPLSTPPGVTGFRFGWSVFASLASRLHSLTSPTRTHQGWLYFVLWTGLSLSLYNRYIYRRCHLAFHRTPVAAGARQGSGDSVLVFVKVLAAVW